MNPTDLVDPSDFVFCFGTRRPPGRKAFNRASLTDEGISILTPNDCEYTVHDNEVPGLFVRVRPTGSKSFYYRPRGRRQKHAQFIGAHENTSVRIARSRALKCVHALQNGRSDLVFAEASRSIRLGAVFATYREKWNGSATWKSRIDRRFERIFLPTLREVCISDLSLAQIQAAIATADVSEATAEEALTMLSSVLSWCVRCGKLDHNLLRGRERIIRLRHPRRTILLDRTDLQRVWDAATNLPTPWDKVVRLTIILGEPVSTVLAIRSDGSVELLDGSLNLLPIKDSFGRAYFDQISDKSTGYLFASKRTKKPLQFQSRIHSMLRAELNWIGPFSIGDISRSAASEMMMLRQADAKWDEFHPSRVQLPKPPYEESAVIL